MFLVLMVTITLQSIGLMIGLDIKLAQFQDPTLLPLPRDKISAYWAQGTGDKNIAYLL